MISFDASHHFFHSRLQYRRTYTCVISEPQSRGNESARALFVLKINNFTEIITCREKACTRSVNFEKRLALVCAVCVAYASLKSSRSKTTRCRKIIVQLIRPRKPTMYIRLSANSTGHLKQIRCLHSAATCSATRRESHQTNQGPHSYTSAARSDSRR